MASELSRRTLYDKLLAAIEELIAAHEDAAPRPPARTDSHAEVTVTAGPFAAAEELRRFQGALSEIPGVRDVRIRGYEGADGAIIDVTLGPSTEDPREEGTQ
jgi:hypothetical protein